eukprot:8563850-Lingulodinium_polyedra.AAC.1
MLPHSLRPKQFSSAIWMTASARLSLPARYMSSSARCVMAMASAPPETLAPPRCLACNCFRCVA